MFAKNGERANFRGCGVLPDVPGADPSCLASADA
jgi:hypothetical protein